MAEYLALVTEVRTGGSIVWCASWSAHPRRSSGSVLSGAFSRRAAARGPASHPPARAGPRPAPSRSQILWYERRSPGANACLGSVDKAPRKRPRNLWVRRGPNAEQLVRASRQCTRTCQTRQISWRSAICHRSTVELRARRPKRTIWLRVSNAIIGNYVGSKIANSKVAEACNRRCALGDFFAEST